MSVVQLNTRTADAKIVECLERILAMAKNGDINELVVLAIGHDPDGEPVFKTFVDFSDGWRLLGAIEHAKATVLHTIV